MIVTLLAEASEWKTLLLPVLDLLLLRILRRGGLDKIINVADVIKLDIFEGRTRRRDYL